MDSAYDTRNSAPACAPLDPFLVAATLSWIIGFAVAVIVGCPTRYIDATVRLAIRTRHIVMHTMLRGVWDISRHARFWLWEKLRSW
jgi:hypothetical protein